MTILQNYLKSKRVQKALSTKPGEEGFSLVELVVVIAVLAILSAVLFLLLKCSSKCKSFCCTKWMVNGLKECLLEMQKKVLNLVIVAFSMLMHLEGYTIRA